MEKSQKYARVIKFRKIYWEPCLSGLRYIFAKDAGALKPLEGSNPSGSAINITYDFFFRVLTAFFAVFFTILFASCHSFFSLFAINFISFS